MSYQSLLAQMATNGMGNPPPPKQRQLGAAPVPSQPHIEPPEYDSGLDPAWQGVLDPNDHALRNALSGMDPAVRQLLLMRLGKIQQPAQATPQANGQI